MTNPYEVKLSELQAMAKSQLRDTGADTPHVDATADLNQILPRVGTSPKKPSGPAR